MGSMRSSPALDMASRKAAWASSDGVPPFLLAIITKPWAIHWPSQSWQANPTPVRIVSSALTRCGSQPKVAPVLREPQVGQTLGVGGVHVSSSSFLALPPLPSCRAGGRLADRQRAQGPQILWMSYMGWVGGWCDGGAS